MWKCIFKEFQDCIFFKVQILRTRPAEALCCRFQPTPRTNWLVTGWPIVFRLSSCHPCVPPSSLSPCFYSPVALVNMINSTLVFFLSASLLDDHSRVRLQALEGEQSSDYINANYVDVSTHTSQHHRRKGHHASPPGSQRGCWCRRHRGPRGPGRPYRLPIISAYINTPRAFILELKVGESLFLLATWIGMKITDWAEAARGSHLRF